ncbi:efflux RND transporter permease subunit [Klebsiella pneumoniae]|nr:efflux RND transporter permease subunit [Klebsiella pneumoniae]
MPELQQTIPAAIDLQIAQDRSPTIRASLEEVEQTLVISVALVILVVFLFLRSGRATLIPAVAVPVSLIGTFAAMYLCGFSLNNLSLMALTIATASWWMTLSWCWRISPAILRRDETAAGGAAGEPRGGL